MLKSDLKFSELNSLSGLRKIDESFLKYLSVIDPELFKKLNYYRSLGSAKLTEITYSEFIIGVGPLVDDFIADLFQISHENIIQRKEYKKLEIIYQARRNFVQKHVIKEHSKVNIGNLDFLDVTLQLQSLIGDITQTKLAGHIVHWQSNTLIYKKELDIAAKYCAIMYYRNSSLELFDVPKKIDKTNHIRTHRIKQLSAKNYIGFDHRDIVCDTQASMHTKYCIYCHTRKKDSCSKGLNHVNPKKYDKVKSNGCPLKQKISEMNFLKNTGRNIAALATVMIDNPMMASTGHRVCNECMKACIFQDQEPVNVPLIETSILEKVLAFTWGVEIYLLLSKWNPLNIDFPLPKDLSGYNVLVTGLGPAGFTLSHYLMNEGHNVTAIDGMKIVPLHFDTSKPIKYWSKIKIPLSQRLPQGFGGVTEYGITNRWNKNYLTLIRLVLDRRKVFQLHDGVRLGSNITTTQAFELGFDHIALCIGTGPPKYINIPNCFAKGTKNAVDFLMNLQQGVPYIKESKSNLQIQIPAVVIGCGLTAIDSAVEIINYYPEQVKKFAIKWKELKHSNIFLNQEEKKIATKYLEHAELFSKAKNSKERLQILQSLGGVTICYRQDIKESSAYKLNYEEIEHAIASGVQFIDNISIKAINLDEYSATNSIEFSNGQNITARSILIAVGSERNQFIDIGGVNNVGSNIGSDIFKHEFGKISYFGDCNPNYSGSVVKALASVKNRYKEVSKSLEKNPPRSNTIPRVDSTCIIHKITILDKNIFEITVKSNMCTNNFKPGQFFKLQNRVENISDITEPIAVTPVAVDKSKSLLTFIIHKVGGSTNALRSKMKEGDNIVLMGPTGSTVQIVLNKKVLLIGDGIRNTLLIPIARNLKQNNCTITFITNYRKCSNPIIYRKEILALSDHIIQTMDSSSFSMIKALNNAIVDKSLNDIDYVYCNLPNKLMNLVLNYKKIVFPHAKVICSINSSMQCMMKGVCGQCIQKTTNKESKYIFSCTNRHYDSDLIDLKFPNNRLDQNSLSEKV